MAGFRGASIVNVHTRDLAAPADVVGRLLDRLGGPEDRLWPSPAWPPMRLTFPEGDRLAVGSAGGHGPIRYLLEEYEPGRRVRFRFDPSIGYDGVHELRIDPLDAGSRCRVTHLIRARAVSPAAWLRWVGVVRPLHDAVLEDLFDRAEAIATGEVARPARWSPWVRLLHSWSWPTATPVAVPDRARAVRDAFDRTDLADAHQVRLRPGMPEDPRTWASAVVRSGPGWVRAAMALRNALAGLFGIERTGRQVLAPVPGGGGAEALVGADAAHLDVRVSLLVDDGAVVASTVARTHNRRGRLYLTVIRPVHPVVVRSVLRRASRQLALDAAAVRTPGPGPGPGPEQGTAPVRH